MYQSTKLFEFDTTQYTVNKSFLLDAVCVCVYMFALFLVLLRHGHIWRMLFYFTVSCDKRFVAIRTHNRCPCRCRHHHRYHKQAESFIGFMFDIFSHFKAIPAEIYFQTEMVILNMRMFASHAFIEKFVTWCIRFGLGCVYVCSSLSLMGQCTIWKAKLWSNNREIV